MAYLGQGRLGERPGERARGNPGTAPRAYSAKRATPAPSPNFVVSLTRPALRVYALGEEGDLAREPVHRREGAVWNGAWVVVARCWQAQPDVTWRGSAVWLLGIAGEPRDDADGSPQRLYVARVRLTGYRCLVDYVMYLAGRRARDRQETVPTIAAITAPVPFSPSR
jgi:hypothetical protein